MILLDTCVISEVTRPRPDPRVIAWFVEQEDNTLRISALTLGELERGVALLDRGPRRDQMAAWIDGLEHAFSDRILPVDTRVARIFGALTADLRRAGTPRPPIDALLAATALIHGCRLATRNIADFDGTGVHLVNPWG